MRFLFLFFLCIAGTSAFTQQPPVIIRQYYDTMKMKIYYEDRNYLQVYKNGFGVRLMETNSADPSGPKMISIAYYDEKMRPFKYPVFAGAQR